MATKIFGDEKIIIREIGKTDKKNAKEFLIFINSLIVEEAKILMNKKQTLKDEFAYLDKVTKNMKNKRSVYIVAEHNGKIVGNTSIELNSYRSNHVAKFAIAILQGYRGIGLGTQLMSEVLQLAKKNINPKPKIIQLEVYANNKPAIALYKKMGFKIVAKMPNQIQWNGKLISEYIMLKYL
jgi:ribosomal protein S18 acetylase RimI-like enzyme